MLEGGVGVGECRVALYVPVGRPVACEAPKAGWASRGVGMSFLRATGLFTE